MRDIASALFAVASLLCVTIPAFASPDTDWEQFRQRFPYHIQVIAVSSTNQNSPRTLIISEPPPSVTLEDFVAAYGDTLSHIETRRHRIGFDGWVQDIVAVLPVMSADEQEVFVADISRYLFGTSYKAYALDLAAPPQAQSTFDLMVGASALGDWLGANRRPASSSFAALNALAWVIGLIAFVVMVKHRGGKAITVVTACIVAGYWTSPEPLRPGAAGRLQPLHGGEPAMLSDLLSQPTTGVYLSETPGLVVLVVPRGGLLNQAEVALREFALDSDLILGAIGTPHSVAVIARERQESVLMLPPLRVETLVQLAAASDDELAQSYERLALFAGRLESIQRDWAPIYLSPQLHDSEYGSLLNVTDQLLKSWSEHGNVKYINFEYPAPSTYPFPDGLLKHSDATMVTYNWNTKGVGYVDSRDGYEVVAFSRTGALPVDYLGEHDSRMREHEETAYEYFAGQTNDPNLARVVQYAGFYQICRHFGLNATFTPSARVRGGADALEPLARRLLDRIIETDLSTRVNPARVAADAELAEALDEYSQLRAAVLSEAARGEPALQQLSRAMVRLREVSESDRADPERRHRILLARALTHAILIQAMAAEGADYAAREFVENEGQNDPDGWIKTPSIVLSWSTAPNGAALVGGHNLSSRISRFAIDESVPAGTVRVAEDNGARVVFYNRADAARIRDVVRSVGRNREMADHELTAVVQAGLRTARAEIPAMPAALRLGSRVNVGGRGLASTPYARVANESPWRLAGEVPSNHARALDAIADPSVFGVVVEQLDGRYLISRAGYGRVLEANSSASALDAVVSLARNETAGRTMHLHFRGTSAEKARAFTRAAEMHGSGSRRLSLRSSVEADSGTLRVLGEIRDGQWNLSRAEVRLSTAKPIASNSRIDFDITIPHRTKASRIVAKISVVLKEGVRATAEIATRLKQQIESLLQAIARSGENLDVLLASRRLVHQLRIGDESIGTVEIRLAGEAGDIQIVKNVHLPQDTAGN